MATTITVPTPIDLTGLDLEIGNSGQEFISKITGTQQEFKRYSDEQAVTISQMQTLANEQEQNANQVASDKLAVISNANQVASDKQTVTTAASQVASDKQTVTTAASQVATIVAALPDGSVNDAITALDAVWSSSKVSTELNNKLSTGSLMTINGQSLEGSGDITISAGGEGASIDFVAKGAVAQGDRVGLNSDGTVSKLANYGSRIDTEEITVTDTNNDWAIDSDNAGNTIVLQNWNGTLYAHLYTMSGAELVKSHSVSVHSGLTTGRVAIRYNSSRDRFVLIYASSAHGTYRGVLSVSGGAITVRSSGATQGVFSPNVWSRISFANDIGISDPVVAFSDGGNSLKVAAVSVSADLCSIGSPVTIESGNLHGHPTVQQSPGTNWAVVCYQDSANSYKCTLMGFYFSGTSLSNFTSKITLDMSVFGTQSSAYHSEVIATPNANEFIVTSHNSVHEPPLRPSGQFAMVVDWPTFSTPTAIHDPTWIMNATHINSGGFSERGNRFVYDSTREIYSGINGGQYGFYNVTFSVSGKTINPGVYQHINGAGGGNPSYSPQDGLIMVTGRDDHISTSLNISAVEPYYTNAPTYVGIAQVDAADTEIIKVATLGGVGPNQSGLTIGADYYVDLTGALTATGPGFAYAGEAIAANKLLVKNEG